MSVETLQPIELRELRGLHTGEGDQVKVPFGFSPSTQNTAFTLGHRVYTRPGMTTRATITALQSMKEFVDLTNTRHLLALCNDGTLRHETGAYSFSTILSDIAEATLQSVLRFRSQTLFGRETICFQGGNYNGLQPPRIYDGASLDPFATECPAAAPALAENATAGSIVAGSHSVRIFFKTRFGYWTSLGPAASYTASGLKTLNITSIPIGPPWITARVAVMTPAFSNTFYFIEGTAMVLNDNSTTSITALDVADSALVAGTQVTSPIDNSLDLFRQTPASPWSGVVHYNGRLVFWGARSGYYRVGDIGPLNFRMQGGFVAGIPNGWTSLVAGASKPGNTGSAYGEVLRITSSGAQSGVLQQGGVQNYLPSGIQIGIRIRMKRNASASSGTMSFFFTTAAAGNALPAAVTRFDVSMSSLSTTEWRVVQGFVGSGGNAFGTTAVLRMSTGTGLNGSVVIPAAGTVDIDYIELYSPTYAGDNSLSRLFFSKAENPEAMDGLNGVQLVASEDGEAITSCFAMKGALFAVKERSTYVLQDTGTGEPVTWPIDIVSSTVGSPARNGVGLGDGWCVLAARPGLYFFDGSEPIRISGEIDGTWKRINWAASSVTMHVMVDTEVRRVYVSAPLDGSASVNAILTLDYGKSRNPLDETGRNWSIWTLSPTCSAPSYRSDGHVAILFGDSSGRVTEVDTTATSDFGGTAISSIYRTSYFESGAGRELLGEITANIKGAGNLTVKTVGPDAVTTTTLLPTPRTLRANPNSDDEWYANARGERLAIEFSTNAVGDGFQLNSLIAWMRPKAAGVVRHHTP